VGTLDDLERALPPGRLRALPSLFSVPLAISPYFPDPGNERESVGMPGGRQVITPLLFNQLRRFLGADVMPILCNLAADRDAAGLLRAWALRPDDNGLPLMLYDRMLELGHDQEAEHVRHFNSAPWQEVMPCIGLSEYLVPWRENLKALFGDFDAG